MKTFLRRLHLEAGPGRAWLALPLVVNSLTSAAITADLVIPLLSVAFFGRPDISSVNGGR